MRRFPFTARHAFVTLAATFVASLGVNVAGAQAVMVSDGSTVAGVSLLPTARWNPLPTGVNAVTSSATCTDPWLTSDFGGPLIYPGHGFNPLCYFGGSVMHRNETFALTWDNHRTYWSETRGYVEQYLRDVADATGSLNDPYADTTQYNDHTGRAGNASSFGGGCIDYGSVGGSACEFGGVTGAGHDFPASACPVWGSSFTDMSGVDDNDTCLTDPQLQSEVATMVAQTGMLSRTTPGYTPLVTLLLPPGVEDCLDINHTLCSANAYLNPPPPQVTQDTSGGHIATGTYRVAITYQTNHGESVPSSTQDITTSADVSTITIKSPPPATNASGWYAYVTAPNGATLMLQGGENTIGTDLTLGTITSGTAPSQPAFCSYHSQVNVGGTEVAYVVQPWTAGTGCDEPDAPTIPDGPTPQQLSVAIGQRLVSPLSQSQIASIVNPGFNGWAGSDGSEIDDNHACEPLGNGDDTVTMGSSSQNPYYIQREFNNGSVLAFDPWTYFGCAPVVNLVPTFVAPSAVNQGDEVQFDGSATETTLLVPAANYSWNFGDGTAAVTGPSLVHTFTKAGTYTVTLTVTDRGGNTADYSQNVTVLTPDGLPAPPPSTGGSGGGGGTGSGGPHPTQPLTVHLQLLPQSLRSALAWGLQLRVSSNEAANGLVTVSISRAAARAAHIAVGRGPSVVIGRGTVSQIRGGTITLRLGLSRKMTLKLRRLRHVAVTVRLVLVPSQGRAVGIVVAGRY